MFCPKEYPMGIEAQLNNDAAIISSQIRRERQELEDPVLKRQKFSAESLSNPVNIRSPPSCLFFKTRLCTNFISGRCMNGANCRFAHGPEELRQEIATGDDDGRRELRTQKTENCKMFRQGKGCRYGEKCLFAHGDPISRGENSDVSIVLVGAGDGHSPKTSLLKTRMCKMWKAGRRCPFNDSCNFAHGDAELMQNRRPMEYDRANMAVSPPRAHLQPIMEIPPSTKMPCVKHQTEGFLKWERLQKISHIYADWIDDFPPRICKSSSEAET